MRVRSPWPWLGLALFVAVGFAVLEWSAIIDPEGLTLSQFVVNISHAWPPIIALFGILIGMLISHFWWPWVPKQYRERCSICGRDVLNL